MKMAGFPIALILPAFPASAQTAQTQQPSPSPAMHHPVQHDRSALPQQHRQQGKTQVDQSCAKVEASKANLPKVKHPALMQPPQKSNVDL